MNGYIVKLFLYAALITAYGCGSVSTNSNSSVSFASAKTDSLDNVNDSAQSKSFDYPILYFDDIYINDDSLVWNDYQIEKRSKMLWLKEAGMDAEVTYVDIKRNGKILDTFEGTYHPLGNEARFGLFPIIAQKTKQLIIEQTAHRDWHYWIVNFSPNPKIIYNSGNYSVGQDLRAIDIDKDGNYELIQSLLSFWFFQNRLSNADSPFIEIIFTYNPKLQKFIPANKRFQDFVLRNIEDDIKKAKEIKPESNSLGRDKGKLGAVLQVVLTYLYAGKENEAWAFYDSNYNLQDKEEMRSKVKELLSKEVVYNALRNF